jgi:hypothetical protein
MKCGFANGDCVLDFYNRTSGGHRACKIHYEGYERMKDEVKFSLRLPLCIAKMIDKNCKASAGNISRNTWILEAIDKSLKDIKMVKDSEKRQKGIQSIFKKEFKRVAEAKEKKGLKLTPLQKKVVKRASK